MDATYHYILLSMLVVIFAGNGVPDTANESNEYLIPDEDGMLELNERIINVDSLPRNSLKHLRVVTTTLKWDSSKSSVSLNMLEMLVISWSYVNPNSITFSQSLRTIVVGGPKFINGTFSDLLSTATNLYELGLYYMDDVVDFCHYSLNPVQKMAISNAQLSCENRSTFNELEVPVVTHNFKELTLEHVKFKEENINFNMATVVFITLKNMKLDPSLLTVSEKLSYCEVNNITLEKSSSIEDWLKPAVNLQTLSASSINKIDICKLHLNTLEYLGAENTHLTCSELKNATNSLFLQQLTLINSSTIWTDTLIMEKLEHLALQNVKFNPNLFKFGEQLKTIRIVSGHLDGSLDDILNDTTHLQTLFISNVNVPIEICELPFSTLEHVTIINLPLRCYSSNVKLFDTMKSFPLLTLRLAGVRIESSVQQLETLIQKSNYLNSLVIDGISSIDLCKLPLSSLTVLNIGDSTLVCSNSSMIESLQITLFDLAFKNIILDWIEPPLLHFNLKNLEIEHTQLNASEAKVGSDLISLRLSFVQFINSKIEDMLSLVTNLLVFYVQHVEPSVDICSPAFQTLVELKIEHTTVVCGNNVGWSRLNHSNSYHHTLIEFQYMYLVRKYPWITEHSKSLRSQIDLSDDSLGSHLYMVVFENVTFQNVEITIANTSQLWFYNSTVDLCRLPFRPFSLLVLKDSDIICSNTMSNSLQHLEELRLENVVCNLCTQNSLIRLDNLKKIEIRGSELPYPIFTFSEKLSWVGFQGLHVQNLNEFLETATNITSLLLNVTTEVKFDICLLQVNKLIEIGLYINEVTCSNPSTVFEKLVSIQPNSLISELNFNGANLSATFPALQRAFGVHFKTLKPNDILDLLSIKSLNMITFWFDVNPQVKTFEFGKVMKILEDAGVLNQPSFIGVMNRKSTRGIRNIFVVLKKKNESFESIPLNKRVEDLGPTEKMKSTESKIFVWIYFTMIYLMILFGIVGNLLSGVVLRRKNLQSSSVVVLLGLVFFDSGYILTYFLISIYNLRTFIKYFVQTEIMNYEVLESTEYDWFAEQENIRTFIFYPLNKTFYTGSVYTTVLISAERFISVIWPLKSKNLLRIRNTKIALIGILLFSILLNLTRWVESIEWNWYSEDSEYWNDYYKPTLLRMHFYTLIYHGWIWITFMYILPFVIIGGANFKIWKEIQLARKKRHDMVMSTAQQNQSSLNDDADQNLALTKMLTCVVAVFVICNIIHISIICYYFLSKDEFELSNIEAISGLPLLLNSSVNFIIYTVLGKAFRSEMLAMLPRFCRTRVLAGRDTIPVQTSSTQAAAMCATQETTF